MKLDEVRETKKKRIKTRLIFRSVILSVVEGKNRHVRRMLQRLGYPVLKLKRERYGFLTLHGLNPGEYRELTPHEVKQMRVLASRRS